MLTLMDGGIIESQGSVELGWVDSLGGRGHCGCALKRVFSPQSLVYATHLLCHDATNKNGAK